MSKTYANRTNAIRAARAALGADAIPSIDFAVEMVAKGQYAWAPRRANGAPAEGCGEGEPSAAFEQAEAEVAAEWKAEWEAAQPAPAEAPKLPNITKNQHLLLAGLAASDFQDGHKPEDAAFVWSWSATDCLPNARAAGGAIAKAAEAGLIQQDGEGKDACIRFTALGAAVYRAQVEGQPMPEAAPEAAKAPGKPSKLDMLIEMVLQPGGAVMADLLAASGWTACHTTVRQECAKRGLDLTVAGKGKAAVWAAQAPAA